MIRKRSTEEEATFYRKIAACGHLSPHIPIVYSIDQVLPSPALCPPQPLRALNRLWITHSIAP